MTSGQKAQFFTQLATMTRGGLPLSQAFAALAVNFHDPAVDSIRRSIEGGNSLESAFALKEFTSFEQSFISAGNQTGQLASSFAALADYWQRESDLLKSVRQSMIYPVVILHLAILLLPIGLIMSNPVQYGVTVLIDFGCLYGIAYVLYRLVRSLWSQPSGQAMILKIPLIGSFWKSVYIMRWMQISRMEFNAGLGLPHAVSDAWKGTGLCGADHHAQQAQAELLAGAELSELVDGWPLFPKQWKGYLVAAETSGQMGDTLGFLADESEKEHVRQRQLLQDLLPKILYFLILIVVAIQMVMSYMSFINGTQGVMKQLQEMDH